MAHLPPEKLSFSDTPRKTLFLTSPGTVGVLVEQRNGQQRERNKSFADPAAALAWCLAHQVNFVFFYSDADAARN
jgi:hypothetical protein